MASLRQGTWSQELTWPTKSTSRIFKGENVKIYEVEYQEDRPYTKLVIADSYEQALEKFRKVMGTHQIILSVFLKGEAII